MLTERLEKVEETFVTEILAYLGCGLLAGGLGVVEEAFVAESLGELGKTFGVGVVVGRRVGQ